MQWKSHYTTDGKNVMMHQTLIGNSESMTSAPEQRMAECGGLRLDLLEQIHITVGLGRCRGQRNLLHEVIRRMQTVNREWQRRKVNTPSLLTHKRTHVNAQQSSYLGVVEVNPFALKLHVRNVMTCTSTHCSVNNNTLAHTGPSHVYANCKTDAPEPADIPK